MPHSPATSARSRTIKYSAHARPGGHYGPCLEFSPGNLRPQADVARYFDDFLALDAARSSVQPCAACDLRAFHAGSGKTELAIQAVAVLLRRGRVNVDEHDGIFVSSAAPVSAEPHEIQTVFLSAFDEIEAGPDHGRSAPGIGIRIDTDDRDASIMINDLIAGRSGRLIQGIGAIGALLKAADIATTERSLSSLMDPASFSNAPRWMVWSTRPSRTSENVFLPRIEQVEVKTPRQEGTSQNARSILHQLTEILEDYSIFVSAGSPRSSDDTQVHSPRDTRILVANALDSTAVSLASRAQIMDWLDAVLPATEWCASHTPENGRLGAILPTLLASKQERPDWRAATAPLIEEVVESLIAEMDESPDAAEAATLLSRMVREYLTWGLHSNAERVLNAFPTRAHGANLDAWNELLRTIAAAYGGRSFAANLPSADESQILPGGVLTREMLSRLPTHWIQALAVAVERAGLLRDEFGTVVAWRASIAAARSNDDAAAEQWSVAIQPRIIDDAKLRRELSNYCAMVRGDRESIAIQE